MMTTNLQLRRLLLLVGSVALALVTSACSLDGSPGQVQGPQSSPQASPPAAVRATATAGTSTQQVTSGPAGLAGGAAAVVNAEQAQPSPSPTLPYFPTFFSDPLQPRPAPARLDPVTRYFTETGHLVGGEFLDFYRNTPNAVQLFGLPISEEFPQQFPGAGVYRVQYFERARMEYHPELPAAQRIQLGALGVEISTGETFAPAASVSNTSKQVYFPQTGHTISGGFLSYWRANGDVRVFGLPISEELTEDGMTVQYFERARMEYHDGLVGTPYAVQLSPVGYMALRKANFNVPIGTLVRFDPPQVAEGHTTEVEVAASANMTVTGQYEGNALLFTKVPDKGMAWALVGAVPFADTGPHPVAITFESVDGSRTTVTRTLNVLSYPFPSESLQFDDQTAKLLDPKTLADEATTLAAIFTGRTPQQYWSGTFRMPLDGSIRVTSYFATRRCYNCPNGSRPTGYHGGMDMAADMGTPVHAPAAGRIVFAGQLAERGNAVIIDHGKGVFSLLAHNSKLLVSVGQMVTKGDVVSLSGSTGLSTGPHVHWEVHVSGPGVEPLEWVRRVMP